MIAGRRRDQEQVPLHELILKRNVIKPPFGRSRSTRMLVLTPVGMYG
jgi:hypothetical protein